MRELLESKIDNEKMIAFGETAEGGPGFLENVFIGCEGWYHG